MTNKEKYLLYGGLALGLLLLPKIMGRPAWFTITDWLIPEFEGFRASPYWDKKQYSWGYGTRAPGSSGTISKADALEEMREHLQTDYRFLSPQVSRNLSANQWAAYLSFAYNLGDGSADNLLYNINSGNDQALENQWKLYINSNGAPDPDLIRRRATEWDIWRGSF